MYLFLTGHADISNNRFVDNGKASDVSDFYKTVPN